VSARLACRLLGQPRLLAEASAGLMHAAVVAQVRAHVPASIISGLLGGRIDCLLRPRITRSKMDARIASSLLAILLLAVLGKGRRVLPIFARVGRLLTESNDSSTPVSLAVSPASPSARVRCRYAAGTHRTLLTHSPCNTARHRVRTFIGTRRRRRRSLRAQAEASMPASFNHFTI